MRFIILFFILAGCASVPKYARNFREYKVSDRREAEDIFRKKLRFIALSYEQISIRDLNETKFSEDCLNSLTIDSIHETESGLLSVSQIPFSSDFGTGLCPQNSGSRMGMFVLVYCEEKKSVYQTSCFLDECGTVDWREQC